jgi:hypothetical protein
MSGSCDWSLVEWEDWYLVLRRTGTSKMNVEESSGRDSGD